MRGLRIAAVASLLASCAATHAVSLGSDDPADAATPVADAGAASGVDADLADDDDDRDDHEEHDALGP